MTTKECPINDAAKEAMVQARFDNPQLRHRVLGSPDPKAYEEVMKMRDKLPLEKWLSMLERVNLKDPNWRSTAGDTLEPSEARLSGIASLAVGVIDRVPTVKEFIDGIIHGAEEILDSWQFLKTR